MNARKDLLQEGLTRHRAGDLSGASELYRRYISYFPRHAGALHLLGLVYFQEGKFGDALKLIDDAIQLAPKEADFLTNRGALHREIGNFWESRRDLELATKLNASSSAAHYNLGNTLSTLGLLDEAINAFSRAIKLNKEYAEAWFARGQENLKLSNYPAAISDLREASRLNNNDIKSWVLLGKALRIGKFLEEANTAFKRSLHFKASTSLEARIQAVARLELGYFDHSLCARGQLNALPAGELSGLFSHEAYLDRSRSMPGIEVLKEHSCLSDACLFVSADENYFDDYFGEFYSSVRKVSAHQFIHLHLILLDQIDLRCIRQYEEDCNLLITCEFIDRYDRVKFSNQRYVRIPYFIERYGCSYILADIDTRVLRDCSALFQSLASYDAAFFRRPFEWCINQLFLAGLSYFSNTHAGIKMASFIANYILTIENSSKPMWFLDQMAILSLNLSIVEEIDHAQVFFFSEREMTWGDRLNQSYFQTKKGGKNGVSKP